MFQRRDMAWIHHEHSIELPERFLGSAEPVQRIRQLQPQLASIRMLAEQCEQLARRLLVAAATAADLRLAEACPEVARIELQHMVDVVQGVLQAAERFQSLCRS